MLLTSPLGIRQSAKKIFILNLNVYRNSHYRTLNTVKIRYKEHMKEQIMKLPQYDVPVRILFRLFPKSRRLTDVSNVCSVHDKFFCDALVECGKLPDDNYLHLPEVKYTFGDVDKNNPRVEIFISNI